MKSRLTLQSELEAVLESKNVYFQPPESIRMKYPCFVYEATGMSVKLADDTKYTKHMRYQLMYITKEPDTQPMIETILDHFKYISYSRHFIIDSLHHDVFDLYY